MNLCKSNQLEAVPELLAVIASQDTEYISCKLIQYETIADSGVPLDNPCCIVTFGPMAYGYSEANWTYLLFVRLALRKS